MQVRFELLGERLNNAFRLAFSHQTGIDENARQPIANRLVNQSRDNGRIDAAGKTANNATVADLLTNLFNCVFRKLFHRPGTGAVADVLEERFQQSDSFVRQLEIFDCRQFQSFDFRGNLVAQRVVCVDQSDRIHLFNLFCGYFMSDHLAEHVKSTNAASVQLSVLGTKVDNYNLFAD